MADARHYTITLMRLPAPQASQASWAPWASAEEPKYATLHGNYEGYTDEASAFTEILKSCCENMTRVTGVTWEHGEAPLGVPRQANTAVVFYRLVPLVQEAGAPAAEDLEQLAREAYVAGRRDPGTAATSFHEWWQGRKR